MRERMVKGFRLILMGGLCLFLFWVGLRWGPGTPEVQATVFERLSGFWPAIPAFNTAPGTFSPPREILLNGSRMHYRVGHVEASFKDVLDFYTELYQAHRGRIVPPELMEKLQSIGDPETQRLVREIQRVDTFMSRFAGRVLRKQGSNSGFVMILDPGKEERGDWGERFHERLERFRDTGRLGDLGVGKVIFVRGTGPDRSLVIAVWLDEDFSVRSLSAPPGEDLPGSDEPDVPRYPGAVRLLSLKEKGEAWRSHTLVYESPDDLTAQFLHYRSQMKAMGWEEAAPMDEAVREALRGERVRALFFTKKGKECAITLQENAERGTVMTVVLYRIGTS